MKLYKIFRVILLTTALALVACFYPKLISAQTLFTISGSVKDSAANTIFGAEISVVDVLTNTTIATAFTTASGEYSVNVQDGTYNINITPPLGSGFTSATAKNKTVTSDNILNFILVPVGTASLSGHVYSALGIPLINQDISLESSTGTVIKTTTNSTGYYFLQVYPGIYFLQVSGSNGNYTNGAPSYYVLTSRNNDISNSVVLDITLPSKKINIHVQDILGNPLDGVRIDLLVSNWVNSHLNIGGNVTNAQGQNKYEPGPVTNNNGDVTLWLFPTESSYTYGLTATPPDGSGFSITSPPGFSVIGETSRIITMQQIVTVSGRVASALGEFLPGQTVSLESNSGKVFTATTDTTGIYTISVSPDTYFLTVSGFVYDFSLNSPSYYKLTSRNYQVTVNTNLDITLPSKKLNLHVQDVFGNPVEGVRIDLPVADFINSNLYISNGISNAQGQNKYEPGPNTDGEGNVTLWLFPTDTAHTYSLTAFPPEGSNFVTSFLANVSLVGDTNQTLIMQQQSVNLSGYLYSAQGNPLPNQNISLESSGGKVFRTTTSSDGFYLVEVPPASYFLEISGSFDNYLLNVPGYYKLTSRNYLIDENKSLDITLPSKKVDIHVQDAFGIPIGGVRIDLPIADFINSNLSISGEITQAQGQNNYVQGPVTDDSGNVTLWLFPTDLEHSYSLIASPPTGGIYAPFTLNDVHIIGNQTEIVSLQYTHEAPVTTISLENQNPDGTYSNPTTVILTAIAANDYSVADTYYKIDGGELQTYILPFIVDGSGDHTITYWSVDNAGVKEAENTKIFNVHINNPPIIGTFNINPSAPSIVNSIIYANADFSDEDVLNSHSATWNWGDSYVTNGGVIESNGMGTITGSHLYSMAGVYTLTLTVTDNENAFASKQYKYVVIYDPSAGFVTGGGQISGSNFGISSKYTQNSQTPSGNIGFTFNGGTQIFASTQIDWLVVDGNTAIMTGSGTINGTGNYYFLVSTADGSPDKLRIKISDTAGNVIYDSQPEDLDTIPPTTPITAGQIKIH